MLLNVIFYHFYVAIFIFSMISEVNISYRAESKKTFILIGEKKFNEVCDIITCQFRCVKIHIELETRLATFWEPPVIRDGQ